MASNTQLDEIDSTDAGQNIEAGNQLSCRNATLTDTPPQSELEGRTEQETIDANLRRSRIAALGNMFRCGPTDDSRHEARQIPGGKQLKFPVVGEVIDVNGDWWDVRDVRDTRHGFELCFGTPANHHGVYGMPRLIATKPLWDFWEVNQTKSHGFLFDLPAGRTTLKRLRRRLGFNFRDDTRDFWTDRIEDLDSMRSGEFAVRHGVAMDVVSPWRRRIVGVRARKTGWWRKAKFRRILLSSLTLSAAGKKLGIGTTHAKRLRDRAKLESQLLRTPVNQKVTLNHDPNQHTELRIPVDVVAREPRP